MSITSTPAYAPTYHVGATGIEPPVRTDSVTSVAGWQPGHPPLAHVQADDVRFARFRTTRDGGYVQADVDAFLDQVEATLRRWEEQTTYPPRPADEWHPASRPQTPPPPSPVMNGLRRVTQGMGYAEAEVDTLLEHAAVALELLRQGVEPEMTADMIDDARFHTTWNAGYDQREVDALLDQVAAVLRGGTGRR